MLELRCEFCGKKFHTFPSKIARGCGRFCSHSCHTTFRNQGVAKAARDKFWMRLNHHVMNDCWYFTGYRNKNGYGQLRFYGKVTTAHRVAWILTFGEIPNGLGVLHKCDHPACCNASHLFLGTPQDNMQDCIAKGRLNTPSGEKSGPHNHPEKMSRGDSHYSRTHPEKLARGERHANAKLTESDVTEIRHLHVIGIMRSELAHRFHISISTIRNITIKKSWRHVP